MASITLPVTSRVVSGAREATGKFGEDVEQGEFVYVDPSDQGRLKLALANSPVSANVLGMSRNAGGAGQPGNIATSGTIVDASGLTAGVVYVLSDSTPGAVMPVADLTAAPTGTYVTVLGVALLTTKLKLGILVSGVQAD